MESEQGDRCSITIPLLSDENAHKIGVCGSEGVGVKQSIGQGDTSFFKTCFNGLNALSGVGILSIPYALASGGWLSIILLLLIASLTFYTAILMKKCMDVDPRIRSYPDIGELAFGTKGRTVISIFMNLELYIVATGFLILEGDNLQNLLPNAEFEIVGILIRGKQMFVVMVALVILPTILLDNLSLLSYISATGVFASVIILGSILWSGAEDGIGFEYKGELIHWKGIPSAVSLYAFCYCAHPVFPTLYTSMKNRKYFSEVLLICFLVCTITYASMAIIGYLMFGPEIQSQITLNLPTNKIASKIAIYTTLVNPIAKYALMVTPIINAIENRFQSYCKRKPASLLIRTILLISTVIVAIAIPFFGELMSLVGAFLSMSASVIIPCLCYLKISGAYRRFGLELGVISFIVLIGVVIVIVGTYTAVFDIVEHL